MIAGFQSALGGEMTAFLCFKRALGSPYARGEQTLRSFDRYVLAHAAGDTGQELEHLVFGWLSAYRDRKPVTVANELGVIRQFCRWRRRTTPGCFVPDRQWASQSTKSVFAPHIFSLVEIRMLLEAAGALHGPRFQARSMRMLLLLLYCTGLRVGEAVRLELGDVDTRTAVLTIRHSKGKTRLVPFADDLRDELEAYASHRPGSSRQSTGNRLLVHANGRPYTARGASASIRALLRRTGLKPARGRTGPRVHDLRHTFAVHRLTEWYTHGTDIHASLPWLSAYMGHDNLLGTELYLNATPELLAIAGERLHARCFGAHPDDRTAAG